MSDAAMVLDGTHLRFSGPLNLESIPPLYARCLGMAGTNGLTVDLAGVAAVDSSALALLLALRRNTEQQGGTFRVEAVPAALHTLAGLYGVGFLVDNTRPHD